MMSPDTVSALFPDRPIRPLPKRRLRERLTPEVAGAIRYPPRTRGALPLFHYPPFTVKEEGGQLDINSHKLMQNNDTACAVVRQQNETVTKDGREPSGAVWSSLVPTSPGETSSRTHQPVRPDQPRRTDPQAPPSITSSIDGYDSFENTNNKKKRKIPSAGDLSVNGAHGLGSEAAAPTLSTDPTTPVNEGTQVVDRFHHGPTSPSPSGTHVANSQGFSGPGRGRFGRSRKGRSPLRALPDGNNAWPVQPMNSGTAQWSENDRGGIISSAIANAGKLPLPSLGQENISLLQQHSSTLKTASTSGQFTFTCVSQVPGTVRWPGQLPSHAVATQAPELSSSNANVEAHNASVIAGPGKAGQSRRSGRRRLEEELMAAARRRRQMAADSFYHNPPSIEDMWVCEFCEYERIFGEPPRALIRDYEIKDRRQRQEEAERKRLLEKAKAKSRKSRKNGKAPSKGGHTGSHHDEHGPPDFAEDQDASPMHQGHSHSTQSEEDYEVVHENRHTATLSERVHPPGTHYGIVDSTRVKT